MGAYCCFGFDIKSDYQPKKACTKQNTTGNVSREGEVYPDNEDIISCESTQKDRSSTYIDRLQVSQYRCTCEDCPRMKIIMEVSSSSFLLTMEKCTSDTTRQRLQRVLLAYMTYDETGNILDPNVAQMAHKLIIERKMEDDDAFRVLVASCKQKLIGADD
uniref:AlNc14C181G8234 protein n=1 Tax=Albugo laibachii Nc14 TaxID=890382 RepID=F0WP86_9STRA|nr:AlNc14C181G8234 [Albugo laibachii Nc14]|eukprot:CCA23132.1 AlNc14C181G8234 [Albugo laibachii Nc14]